jgi:hypothetical protein
MPEITAKPAIGADGGLLRDLSSSDADNHSIARDRTPLQAQNLVRRSGARLRLEARISVTRGREPYGRTRPLKLTEPDLEQLIDFALELEGRA